MYRIIILLFLITMPVFAEQTTINRIPYYDRYYTPHAYYGGNYPSHAGVQRRNYSSLSDINELERYVFNRNFTRDCDEVRLERLETLAFGAVQEGDISTRYNNVRASLLSRPKPNYKPSLLQSISEFFSGQLTGFTPSINNAYSSDIYPSDYKTSSYSSFNGPFGKGYRINNYEMGTGSGIQFLD